MKLKIKKTVSKKSKPLEYELFVRIKCPKCSKGDGEWAGGKEKDKRIFIEIPYRKRPNTIRCFLCDTVLDISKLKEQGVEIRRR